MNYTKRYAASRCKMCGTLLRYPEDSGRTICGLGICPHCEPIPEGKIRIREYFRPPRGDPGRREDPPGGSPESAL